MLTIIFGSYTTSAEVPHTVSSTQPGFEPMTSRSWRYISCPWYSCPSYSAIRDFHQGLPSGTPVLTTLDQTPPWSNKTTAVLHQWRMWDANIHQNGIVYWSSYCTVCCRQTMHVPLHKKIIIHQVTTMLATCKNVLFPGYNHQLTTGTNNLTF